MNTKGIKEKQRAERIGLTAYNKQGCLMKLIEYKSSSNITVKFLDKYGYERSAEWKEFNSGSIVNPYFPSVCGVGIVGTYIISKNGKHDKEYVTWKHILSRCFNKKDKTKNICYKDVTVCEEWLYYPNFYEWLHNQENFDKWANSKDWAIDKDILIKGNKIYSPETCCLVPQNVNNLFTKNNRYRGNLPIGVTSKKNKYLAEIIYGNKNNVSKTTQYSYPTPEDAFYLGYKPYKEKRIKEIAQEEFDKGNITKNCYDAMMNYEVEITD